MLVLARRLNERIIIPCIQTAVQVVKIQGGIVRLGIDAPADVQVLREEILSEERAEKPSEPAAAAPDDHRRLADVARDLSALRRQLRGKLPAAAAAALFRIDRELAELAGQADKREEEAVVTPGTTFTVPAAR
jgi:carbon storage regulator